MNSLRVAMYNYVYKPEARFEQIQSHFQVSKCVPITAVSPQVNSPLKKLKSISRYRGKPVNNFKMKTITAEFPRLPRDHRGRYYRAAL